MSQVKNKATLKKENVCMIICDMITFSSVFI